MSLLIESKFINERFHGILLLPLLQLTRMGVHVATGFVRGKINTQGSPGSADGFECFDCPASVSFML